VWRAVALGFETAGESVDRRTRQFDAALSARLTAAWAGRRLPTTASPPMGPLGPAAAPAAPRAWPLALGGLALLGGVTVALRRGRRPRP
jgi:hypothetical protein